MPRERQFMKKAYLSALLIIMIFMTGCMSIFPKKDEMLLLPVTSTVNIEYKIINPTRGDIVNTISLFGNVDYVYENLAAQQFAVNGYIDKIFVEIDQHVEEGQLIATLLDPEDKQQVEDTYNKALNEFLKIYELYSKNSASEYQFRNAEINYNHAKEKYDDLVFFMNNKELKASQSGYIVDLYEFTGETVEGQPFGKTLTLCSIATGQNKSITGTATAANVAKMQVGNSVTIISKNVEYEGYVLQSEGSDLMFGLDDMSVVTAGEVVQVQMKLEEVYDVIKLPKYAVSIIDAETGTIRVLTDDIPTSVTVNIGLTSSSEVEILSGQGIDENTNIITGTN
jgi:multidrug efflux pump subunit AcrA (membrane-fusion protein)